MLPKEDFIVVEVLGKDDPQVRALVAAASNPGMEGVVHEMLRSLARQRGIDPDAPPRFALPQGISPSDFVIGSAKSGDVIGEEIGLSEADLPSHVGVFGTTSSGKTTLVKVLLLGFTGK
jgi:DNA helicase HerA-like ATPase